MARGNEIIVSAQPNGHFTEGFIGAGLTPKPGTIMQLQPATALRGGRHTWELYNADLSGGRPKGPHIVLQSDDLQGKVATEAYAAGDRAFGYVPLPGDELNLLLANVSGTATIPAGTMLIVEDATGKLIATTGTPEAEVAMLLEDVVDVAADVLAWCQWTGH